MSAVLAAAAFGVFLVLSALLSVIDVRAHRLPDAVVVPGLLAAMVLFSCAAAVDRDPARIVGVVASAAALFAAHLALHLGSAGGWGGGDVKTAALVGAHLGWFGPDATVTGALAGTLLGGAAGLGALSVRRGADVALGPALLAGGWWAILAATVGEV